MTVEELADIHASAFQYPRPWSSEEFAALLASPYTVLVEAVQGFALGRVVAGEAELLTIAVRPDARRQGVGSRLLSDLIEAASERGAQSIFLEVAADNQAAISLYHMCGFREHGRRKAYYSMPSGKTDALTYRLSIQDRPMPEPGAF